MIFVKKTNILATAKMAENRDNLEDQQQQAYKWI